MYHAPHAKQGTYTILTLLVWLPVRMGTSMCQEFVLFAEVSVLLVSICCIIVQPVPQGLSNTTILRLKSTDV